MINGGGFSRWGLSLIGLEDIMGGALTVVAPPLGTFGRVIGPFAGTSCVGWVVIRGGPVIHGGECSIAHQRCF